MTSIKVGALCSCILVLFLHEECSADCSYKPPMDNFNASLNAGKFYLIAEKPGLPHQMKETCCVTANAINPQQKTFKYILTEESKDGKVSTVDLTVTHLTPPGHLEVSVDKTSEKFESSILGASNKYHVTYECREKVAGAKEGFWIYYYQRVQGVNAIDSDSLAAIKDVLKKNNLSLSDAKETDNQKCKSS